MIRYSSLKSPLGTVFVAASGRGVCCVGIRATERWLLVRLREFAPQEEPFRDDAALAHVVTLLRRYLRGDDARLDGIEVDLSACTPFQRAVYAQLRRVPRGKVVCYGELAERVGRPKAARAIGNALGSNPVPLLVPCHRVIRSDGSLGGFGCGIDVKEYLLRLEGASFQGAGNHPGETHAQVHHGR